MNPRRLIEPFDSMILFTLPQAESIFMYFHVELGRIWTHNVIKFHSLSLGMCLDGHSIVHNTFSFSGNKIS